MAHRMLKPYSLIFYPLSIIFSFIVGLYIAKLTGAGKGQMLAGGAIVFFYGLVGSLIGFCMALAVTYFTNKKTVVRLNILLLIAVVGLIATTKYLFDKRQEEKAKQEKTDSKNTNRPVTKPVDSGSLCIYPLFPISNFYFNMQKRKKAYEENINTSDDLGLGFFAPHFSTTGNINFLNKCDAYDNQIMDSLVFYMNSVGQLDIKSAPPWLYPEHLKIDYEILLFKIITNYGDYLEIEVNKQNSTSYCVNSEQGRIIYWSEFLLSVFSIEAIKGEEIACKVKPLDHASEVLTPYHILKPVAIKDKWIKVELIDDNFESLDTAWVKWTDGNSLLVNYSLLS